MTGELLGLLGGVLLFLGWFAERITARGADRDD